MNADLLARLDRIPIWALPHRYLAIIGLGYFFVFFDIANIGYALPAISDEYGLTKSEGAFVAVAIGLVGYSLGSLSIGVLADRFGRYRMLVLTMVLTAVGSFGDAAAQGLISLAVFRFITGMGVGADLNLVTTYVSELAPARVRGRIAVATFMIGILGQAITPFVAWALVPHFDFGWRLMFVIGGAIAVLGLLVRTVLPESPRWEVTHGRDESAARTIDAMEQCCREKCVELEDRPETEPDEPQRGSEHFYRRLTVLIAMWFLWYIGNYAFLGDGAQLLADNGAAIGGSIALLAIGAIGYPLGALAALRTVDRFERRLVILAASVVWLIAMAAVGSFAGDVVIAIGCLLASMSLGCFLQVAYTFTAECFSTNIRATGFALSDGIGHAGGAVGVLLLPVLVTHWSFGAGFTAIGLTGLAAGVVALLGPKATRRRLEHISA